MAGADILILKFIEKGKKARIIKTILEKHTVGSTLPNFKTFSKVAVMSTVW